MSELKTKMIIKALIGAIISMLICLFISTFANDPAELIVDRFEFIIQFIGAGIYGAIPMGGSIVYEFERWSLLKATLIHYFMTMGALTVTNVLLGWFAWNIYLVVLLAMTVAYFIIWLVNYLSCKREIERINNDLSNMRLN